ncbi:hypothetical protein ACFQZZ_22305 [Nocardia sp. GCM10030253]|uniref:hypothetical protein n=1 Tax=Nocardia sp. GCM10030253 TaxID=3273404 RepID=UPI00363B3709
MPHGHDVAAPTRTTIQTTHEGAATMAEYRTTQNTLDAAIRGMLEQGSSPEAAETTTARSANHAAAQQTRTTTGFPGGTNGRRSRQSTTVPHGQGFHAQPRRPLRIPGR